MEVFLTAVKEIGSLAIVAFGVWFGLTKLNSILMQLNINTIANTAALNAVQASVENMRHENENMKRDNRDAVADARDAKADARDAKAGQ